MLKMEKRACYCFSRGKTLKFGDINLETYIYRPPKSFCLFMWFLKGTTSNGRGLLKFAPFTLTQDAIHGRHVQIVTLYYRFEYVAPVYTAGNVFLHSIRLCGYPSHHLNVSYLTHQESVLHNDHHDLKGKLSDLLAHTGRLSRVQLGMDNKRDFLRYYYNQ